MRKVAIALFGGVVFLVAALSACSTVQPDAGHEAVLVRKPLVFGSGGVDETPVRTGLKYVAFTTKGVEPMSIRAAHRESGRVISTSRFAPRCATPSRRTG